jgi:hypothetical protein
LYTATAEDRKSLTMIETIVADGTAIPPVMIIQGKQHMESWYSDKLEPGVRVVLSDSGYTNKEISLILLDHIILHTNAGMDKPCKVLLMDQHRSHMDPDFILKATAANIHPYPFPRHLTHILQPLDVGVFQPYKHWHSKAVQHAMRNLDLDYNIASFMRDLTEIRTETFKKGTIHSAFRNAGIWPISCKTAIAKIKVYSPPEAPVELPTLPRTPTRFQHAEYGLLYWKGKVSEKLSSPSCESFDSWARGTERVLAGGELTVLQHKALTTKVQNQQKAKYRNRNVLQKNGVLTTEDAWAKKAANEAKRQAIFAKRRATLIRITRNKIKNELKTRGIAARKLERERKKQVEALQKSRQFIPVDLLEAIPDPELSVTAADIDLQLRKRMISISAEIDLDLDAALREIETVGSLDTGARANEFELQADYVSLLGFDNGDMDWNSLDADEDAEINLF